MNFLEKLSPNLRSALDIANLESQKANIKYVGSEHLIYAFLKIKRCVAYSLLDNAGATLESYEYHFRRSFSQTDMTKGLTPRTVTMFTRAVAYAESNGGTFAGTVHFLYAVLQEPNCFAVRFLSAIGVDIEELKEKTKRKIIELAQRARWNYNENEVNEKREPEEKVEKKEVTLQSFVVSDEKKKQEEKTLPFGIDLTEKAKRGKIDPVIGRKKEIEKVVQILSRRSKNNPVLVGEPGVGKSAIAEGLASLIVSGNVPEQLINKKIFSVDIAGMLAGAKFRGEFEERLKDLMDTVMADGDIVLFIDEIHNIVGAGATGEGNMDAANILKPMLARGDLQVIGATTIEEYRKYIEKDAALARRFTNVDVEEPSTEEAVEILKGLRPKYEEHHGIRISDEAIESAVKLSSRYITDRFLPDKAIDLIDEAAARARIISKDGGEELESLLEKMRAVTEKKVFHEQRREYKEAKEYLEEEKALAEKIDGLRRANNMARGQDGRFVLGKEQIAVIVSTRTKIPLLKISQEEGEKLMRLEADLHKRIIGQEEAVSAVAKAIRRARAGLKDPSRPIGSFIFVGPTGVGKTDLCKALAESLFGNEEQMIRLDMSEYMEKQSISKLIGAAPGYVGYDDLQTGQLTDKIRTKPYSVILFDEIEKAHPDVFNLLLQILDDGRLTDNKGRTVSFKNAVIILTSNVGASQAEQSKDKTGVYGFGGSLTNEEEVNEKAYQEMKDKITNSLKERFKPEFLNRLDDVIVFHKLTKPEAMRIANKLVESLANRLNEQRNIVLNVTNEALERLVDEGYDSEMGARPLKRIIQRRIEDKLSEEILLQKVSFGDKIFIDYRNGDYVFLK